MYIYNVDKFINWYTGFQELDCAKRVEWKVLETKKDQGFKDQRVKGLTVTVALSISFLYQISHNFVVNWNEKAN